MYKQVQEMVCPEVCTREGVGPQSPAVDIREGVLGLEPTTLADSTFSDEQHKHIYNPVMLKHLRLLTYRFLYKRGQGNN